ncbi:MAG: hypothetical protein WC321_03680 [Candidatus Omnitrophota bacterium]|jgi:hypothetical protein
MKFKLCLLVALVGVFLTAGLGLCAETCPTAVIFGFEEKVPSWSIPDWCFEKEEYVGESIAISEKFADEGKSSLELMTKFPGGKWTAGYIEVQQYFDWTPYKTLSVDIYLPKEAPFGLQARFILTVGENWTWTEMARLVKLVPGEWTTISASLIPGSTDWRRTQVDDEFRSDIRKLGIRFESNMRPVYTGPVYIDNLRLE